MNIINPSTQLKVVSVSKLKSLTCLRKYFWRYILNLESKGFNNNFWYGAVNAAGFEALLMGKTDKQIKAAMKAEDLRRIKGRIIKEDMVEELKLQRRLIETIVFGAAHQPEVKRMHMTHDQIKFSTSLKCGVTFCGTEDGEGTYRNQPCMFENKALSSVTDSYVESLTYGKQVNGYAWAQRRLRKTFPNLCVGCLFKKTHKIVKQGQTFDSFIDEIHTDIHGGQIQLKTKVKDVPPQPKKFYRWHKFKLGRSTVTQTGQDIEREAYILKLLYKDCGGKLLEPSLWPKQEEKCNDYSGCEYIQLCKNPATWQLYLRFYQQREMLYEQEHEELD
jgi:hypothetical protein